MVFKVQAAGGYSRLMKLESVVFLSSFAWIITVKSIQTLMERRIFFKNAAFTLAGFFLLPRSLKGGSMVHPLPDDREKFFTSPSAEFRPWVVWYWMDGHITKEGITLDLEMLQRNGFGGAFIYHHAGKIPPGPVKTGSNPWLDAAEHAVREAGRLGLDIMLEFPSNLTGEQSPAGPEFLLRKFAWTAVGVPYGKKIRLKFPLPESRSGEYRDFRVLAYPSGSGTLNPELVTDVSGLMNEKGVFTWTPPAPGNWKVVRTGSITADGQPLMDLMNEESLRLLAENLESSLLPRLSGKGFRGFFTSGELIPKGYWSVADEEYFSRQEPFNHLPWLLEQVPEGLFNEEMTERFRNDHHGYRQDRVVKIVHRGVGEWCRKHGFDWCILPGGITEAGQGSFPASQPGWGPDNPEPEEFRTGVVNGLSPQHDSPWHIRMVADSLFLSGWNRLVITPFFHQPYLTGLPGMSAGYPGWAAGRNSAWAEHTAGMTRYLGRISSLLQQGSAATDYVVCTGDLPEEHVFSAKDSLASENTFGYLTPGELTQCVVNEGSIVHPDGRRSSVCVIPPGIQLYALSVKKLAELTESGMTLLVVTPPKIRLKLSDNETEINRLAESLFGGWDGVTPTNREVGRGRVVFGRSVSDLLQEKSLPPDLVITPRGSSISFVHRVSGESHLYLLRNDANQYARINCSFRHVEHNPEVWDPESAQIYTAPIYEVRKQQCVLPLDMPANGVLFVVFRKKATSSYLKKVSVDGKLLWDNPLSQAGKASPGKTGTTPDHPDWQGNTFPVPFTFRGNREGGLNALFVQNGNYDFEVNNWNAEEHIAIYVNNCFSVVLDSSWKIRFPAGSGAPALYEPVKLESLSENSDFNIRHFSGVCVYETTFYLTDSDFITHRKFILDLGKVMVSARVFLNEQEAGLAWGPPFVSDVTSYARTGENRLRIEVAVPWMNRLTGDEQLPVENEYTSGGIIAKLPDWYVNNLPKPGERKTFLAVKPQGMFTELNPSGLLGPVRLMFAEERML